MAGISPNPWAEGVHVPDVVYQAGCNGMDTGTDSDGNGISDMLETFLANEFKPAFYINNGNPLAPMPVEVMDRNGDSVLGCQDAFVWVEYLFNGGASGGSFTLPFCEAFPESEACASVFEFFDEPVSGQYSGTLPEPLTYDDIETITFYTFFDYGTIGDDGPGSWQSYAMGEGSFSVGAHRPKIYCHMRNAGGGIIQIQYWFFYPYNDAYNDHEGDWEHITVKVERVSDCAYRMKTVYFFFHEDYFDYDVCDLDAPSSEEDAPYRLDGTHPVVFVGGTFQGSGGTGDEGGGSYPMFGDFLTRMDVTEHVRSEGTTLHYNEVDMEIMPEVRGAVDLESWYREDPSRQWMGKKIRWGYPFADSPFDAWNASPVTPSYHETWSTTTGSAFQRPVEAFWAWWLTAETIVMVSPMCDGEFINANIEFENWDSDGDCLQRGGTQHITVEDSSQDLKITAVSLYHGENDEWYRFVGWNNGENSNPLYLDTPPTFDFGFRAHYHLEALYERLWFPPVEWQERLDVFGGMSGISAAWGDYDNDGRCDLFLQTSGLDGMLLRNSSEGFVVEETLFFEGGVAAAEWGDMDNDGALELVVVPSNYFVAPIQIVDFDQGGLTQRFDVRWMSRDFLGCSIVDVDNNGNMDIVLSGVFGNPGTTVLRQQNDFSWVKDSEYCSFGEKCAWADFDQDGLVDVCALGSYLPGGNFQRNTGDSFDSFTGLVPSQYWDNYIFSAAFVDYDRDGLLDIFQGFDLLRNTGIGFHRTIRFPFNSDNSLYANWADFDNDGWIDVIINGRLFWNHHGSFTELTGWIGWDEAIPGQWQWIDFDGDGDLDLFSVANGVRLFENKLSAPNSTIRVKLVGKTGARSGVGATISWPGGVLSCTQNSAVPNSANVWSIGTGDVVGLLPLRVGWPSGFVSELAVDPAETEVEIVEPGIFEVSGGFAEGAIPGSIDLEFSWQTDFECLEDGFRIVMEDEFGSWQGCVAPVVELNSANCLYTQLLLGDGQWQHTVRYENIECQDNCFIPFWVGCIPSDFPEIEIKKSGPSFFLEECPSLAIFTNVSTDSGLEYPGTPYSGLTLNLDGDIRKDLLISISDGATQLKDGLQALPNGSPRFSTENSFPMSSLGFNGVAAADYDNDGDEDIFVANASGGKLFRNDAGVLIDVTTSLGLDLVTNLSTAAAWGDFDRDGWLDLYVVRSFSYHDSPAFPLEGEQHRLFKNCLHENLGFVDVTSEAGLLGIAAIGSMTATWADIDADGDLDLFVGDNQEIPVGPGGIESLLFINQDDGTFQEELVERLPSDQFFVSAVQFADIDNDAFLDLVLCRELSTPQVYLNDGLGSFLDQPVINIVANEGYSGVQVFDHDLNGTQDLLFTSKDVENHSRSFVTVLENNLPVFLENTSIVGLAVPGEVLGSVSADFTGDGDVELFLGKAFSGGNFFFKTETQEGADSLGKNYVKIKLNSPYGANNTFGLGSSVVISAGTHTQIQQVDGGSGRGGQNDRELIFGLGEFTGPVSATVRWLGGNIQEVVPLVISNQISGETLNTIVDDTEPVISEVSATFIAQPVTNTIDWTFTWETDVSCKESLDALIIDQSGLPVTCWPEGTTITPETPNVDHTYDAKPGGGYIHKFVVENQDCTPSCSFRFSVSSGTDHTQVSSSVFFKRVKICPWSN
jgi:hypothetical protein